MRNRELIRGASADHEVHLISVTWQEELKYLAANRRHVASLTFIEKNRSRLAVMATGLRGLLKRRPLAIAPFFLEAAAEKIHSFLLHNEIDLIVFEESLIAPYLDAIPGNCRARVVIDFHNVISSQSRTMSRMGSGPWKERVFCLLHSFLMRNWEARYARRVDHCVVVSDQEASRLGSLVPRVPISVVPNGTGLDTALGESKGRNTLLFTGTFTYEPNADAVRFFCRSILPLIQRRIPNVKLYIVGIDPSRDIRALGASEQNASAPTGNIVVTGEVPDVAPYYENANVAIVPLRAGGGTRLKILEAMALGRPVVSTAFGCEGLAVKHGEHLMIADHPEDFADRVTELLENPELVQRLCRNARRLVESRYDWAALSAQFSKICSQVAKDRIATAMQATFPI